jgi:hypothetical protein
MRASSAGSVSIVSVLRFVAVFSTIAKGCPGFTRVILKNVEPKSKPITIACAVESSRERPKSKKRYLL